MDKNNIEIFNHWADKYDKDIKLAEKHDDWLYRDYSKILITIMSKIKEYCPSKRNKTIIDIGAGTGNLLLMASNAGYSIIGIEPSQKMCARIKNKGFQGQIIAADFLHLSFKSSSIDIIVSSYAWHHLPEKQKIKSIDEMKRVLRRNGVIIIADLMFASQGDKQKMVSKLRREKNLDLIADIESEYYGDIRTLSVEFSKRGFNFGSRQLTELVWLIEARLPEKSMPLPELVSGPQNGPHP